jgi:hypothetical protein
MRFFRILSLLFAAGVTLGRCDVDVASRRCDGMMMLMDDLRSCDASGEAAEVRQKANARPTSAAAVTVASIVIVVVVVVAGFVVVAVVVVSVFVEVEVVVVASFIGIT